MVGWLIKTAGGVLRNHPLGAKTPFDDRMTLRGRNDPPGLVGTAGFWWFCPDWEGGFESGGWNGCLCPESGG